MTHARTDEPDEPGEPGVAAVRARLLAERARTRRRLGGLSDSFHEVVAASRDTNADDEHDPEGATIAFERSQLDALSRQALMQLHAIDEALARLGEGTYGRCTTCGDVIAPARLEVRPAAAECIGCAGRRRR